MNKTKKYYLLTCLVLTVILLTPALAAAENTAAKTKETTVTVSGYAEQKFTPDSSEITLGVQTEAATVTLAQAQNAKIAGSIYEQLTAIGVKKEDLKTSGYSVNPVYQTENSTVRKQTLSGYRVFNSIIVTTSPDKIAQIIDTALKNGANQVTGLRFSLKDNQKASQETISLAVKDALSKIDSIAKTLGKKAGRIQLVAEQGTSIRGLDSGYMIAAKQANEFYESTPISSGTVTVSANVQVTAELY